MKKSELRESKTLETQNQDSPNSHSVFDAISALKLVATSPPFYIVLPLHDVSNEWLKLRPD